MKKIMFAGAVFFAAVALFSRDLNINGSFRKLNKEKNRPNSWSTDAKPYTGKILPGRKPRTNALQITTQEKPVTLYTAGYNVKAGEKIEFSLEFKGKGKAFIQLNLCGERGKGFLKAERLQTAEAKETWTELKGTFVIPAECSGKPVKTVRFMIGAEPGSDITFEKLEAESSGDEDDED